VPDKYSSLSSSEQIEVLKGHALNVLGEYEMDIASIESINHEYNSTYKVVNSDGEAFALRINVNSDRTYRNTLAEIDFVNYLRLNAEINVPTPIESRAGEIVLVRFNEVTNKEMTSVLYSWLDGEEIGHDASDENLFALGAIMAKAHIATANFSLPKGSELPIFTKPIWGSENLLLSPSNPIADHVRTLYIRMLELIEGEVQRLFSQGTPQVIHADLHGGNVMECDGELSIFDFDDSGIGFPIQDLATSIYYLDSKSGITSLKRGYESVAPLPLHDDRLLEILLLQRRLTLMNYLYGTTTPEHREMVPSYQDETIRRIERFLEPINRG